MSPCPGLLELRYRISREKKPSSSTAVIGIITDANWLPTQDERRILAEQFRDNIARDEKIRDLEALGWKVLVVCAERIRYLESLKEKIQDFLKIDRIK